MRRLVVALLLASNACHGDAAARRARLLRAPVRQRLAGTWQVAFVADPHSTTIAERASHDTVVGLLVFAPNDHGPLAVAGIDGVTHEGAYDLDFAPFGWTTRGRDAAPTAIARVVIAPGGLPVVPGGDSLYVVLSPGTERFAVQMSGVLVRDTATGVWSALAHSAGGGEGRFVMVRRGSAP
jgi:hypothetical protein